MISSRFVPSSTALAAGLGLLLSLPSGPARAGDVGDMAEHIFATRCATCHGVYGEGDGVLSKTLKPKPRSFRDPAWHKTVTDEHLRAVIVGGGGAVKLSPLMPPHADLGRKKAVLDRLVQRIRALGEIGHGTLVRIPGRSDLIARVRAPAGGSATLSPGPGGPAGKAQGVAITTPATGSLRYEVVHRVEEKTPPAAPQTSPAGCQVVIARGTAAGGKVPVVELKACGAKLPEAGPELVILRAP